jgi:hypothetical protein
MVPIAPAVSKPTPKLKKPSSPIIPKETIMDPSGAYRDSAHELSRYQIITNLPVNV